MIAIKNIYNHDEIKIHKNPEIEIIFEDNTGKVQWIGINLKN